MEISPSEINVLEVRKSEDGQTVKSRHWADVWFLIERAEREA